MDISTKEQARKKRTLIAGIITGVVVIGLYVGIIALSKPKDSSNVVETSTPSPVTSPAPAGSLASFRDGTYTATGVYTIPVGEEQVQVALTLSQGVVTDAKVIFSPKVTTSEFYQEQFASGYKQFVVGKRIDEIQLTKVSGSSLTPEGFNNALEKIKVQAKA